MLVSLIKMKIALEGTACLGKSSCIDTLAEMGFPVIKGDFGDHIKQFNCLKTKKYSSIIQGAYGIFLNTRSQDNHLHDRSPLANIIYDLIHQVLEEQQTEEAAYEDLEKIMPLLRPMLRDWFVIVLESSETDEHLLNRMKKRNNGIDVMSLEYVRLQNNFWNFLANKLGLLRLCVSDWPTLHFEVARLVNLLISGKPIIFSGYSKQKPNSDAGYDLTCEEDQQIEANVATAIKLRERVYIPSGYHGHIIERSSASFDLSVRGGIIDAHYMGPLSATVISPTSHTFKKYSQFCQLVIKPVVDYGNIIIAPINFNIPSERGENRFGSTGGYKENGSSNTK